jgi:hypothetical protein
MKFYFNRQVCKIFEIEYDKAGNDFIVHKDALNRYVKPFLDKELNEALDALPSKTLVFANEGLGWFTFKHVTI